MRIKVMDSPVVWHQFHFSKPLSLKMLKIFVFQDSKYFQIPGFWEVGFLTFCYRGDVPYIKLIHMNPNVSIWQTNSNKIFWYSTWLHMLANVFIWYSTKEWRIYRDGGRKANCIGLPESGFGVCKSVLYLWIIKVIFMRKLKYIHVLPHKLILKP